MITDHDKTIRPTRDVSAPSTPAEELLSLTGKNGARLYAVVDAAAHEALFQFLAGGNPAWYSLFQGTPNAHLLAVGPVLICCSEDLAALQWLTSDERRGKGLVFIVSEAPVDQLVGHMQSLLRAVTGDDRELFFRWYDPQVLPVYLSSCDQEALWRFFGPAVRVVLLASFDDVKNEAKVNLSILCKTG